MSQPSARDATALSIFVALSFALAASPAAEGSNVNWTQDGGDAGRTRYIDVDVNPNAIRKLWEVPILYPHTTSHVWGEWDVAIDEHHVYRTAVEGYPPSGDFHILALDLDSGDQEWIRTLKGGAHAGVLAPSVGNGIVYVNRAGHSGISGGSSVDFPKLYGFDAQTGQQRFVTNYSSQWGSYDRPHVFEDTVIMEGGYYGGTYGYNALSGSVRWFKGDIGAYLLAEEGFYSTEGLSNYATGVKISAIGQPAVSTSIPVLASTLADLLLVTTSDANGTTLSAFNETGESWKWDYKLDGDYAMLAAN